MDQSRSAEWQVRRRWLPHRDNIGVRARFTARRRRRRAKHDEKNGKFQKRDLLDIPSGGDGCLDEIGFAVLVIVVIAFVIFVGWPVLLILLDLLWLVAIGLVGIGGKVLFRRPWRVEAVSSLGDRHEWDVVGFRRSGALRDDVKVKLATGVTVHADRFIPPPGSA